MKKALTLLYCLWTISLYSQAISFSEEIGIHNDLGYEIIGKFQDRILLFRDQDMKFKVQGFDERMQEIWEKELELEKRSPKYIGVVSPNSKEFNLFYTHRKKGHPLLKVHKYDAEANLIDSLTVKDFGFKPYTPSSNLVFSEDKSKVLIYHLENNEVIHAISFDMLKMETIWEKTFDHIDTDFGRDLYEIILTNNGELRVILVKNNFTSKNKPHHYEIYPHKKGQAQYDSYKVAIEEKLTYDVLFKYDNLNKGIVAGGLYSEKNRSKAVGYFYLNVPDNQGDSQVLNYYKFEDDFVAEFLDKPDKKEQKNKGLYDTFVKEIILRRDGGILMVGERNKDTERNNGVSNQSQFSRYGRFVEDHFYDDLFVISLHPDGSQHWEEILHKKQYSYDDGGIYSSYFLLKTPSNLRFLFNDEVKEENTVSEYIVKGNGTYDRRSIMNTQDQELRLRFMDSMQVSSRTVIVPSEHRRRLRLVKMEF